MEACGSKQVRPRWGQDLSVFSTAIRYPPPPTFWLCDIVKLMYEVAIRAWSPEPRSCPDRAEDGDFSFVFVEMDVVRDNGTREGRRPKRAAPLRKVHPSRTTISAMLYNNSAFKLIRTFVLGEDEGPAGPHARLRRSPITAFNCAHFFYMRRKNHCVLGVAGAPVPRPPRLPPPGANVTRQITNDPSCRASTRTREVFAKQSQSSASSTFSRRACRNNRPRDFTFTLNLIWQTNLPFFSVVIKYLIRKKKGRSTYKFCRASWLSRFAQTSVKGPLRNGGKLPGKWVDFQKLMPEITPPTLSDFPPDAVKVSRRNWTEKPFSFRFG